MFTILGIGDAPHPLCTSGFGRVTGELFGRIAQDPTIDFHWVGVHSKGDPTPDQPFTIWHCLHETLSCQRAVEVYERVQPDLLVVFSDIAVCGQWVAAIAQRYNDKLPCPLVVYCPVDGANMLPGLAAWVREYTIPERVFWATYTTWGAQQLFRCLVEAGMVPGGNRMWTIPHAVDHAAFAPMTREDGRAIVFPDNPDEDAWIVLNANTNTPRKRADLTVLGFVRFLADMAKTHADKKPNAKLYLHMSHTGTFPIVDLFESECRRYGIEDWEDYLIWEDVHELHSRPQEWLRALYAACDAGINTCAGEGWGLVNWEHASMGRVQILPCHTAFQEIFPIGSAAWMLPVLRCSAPEHGQDQELVSIENVAEAIERVYLNRKNPWCEAAAMVTRLWTWQDAAVTMYTMMAAAGGFDD